MPGGVGGVPEENSRGRYPDLTRRSTRNDAISWVGRVVSSILGPSAAATSWLVVLDKGIVPADALGLHAAKVPSLGHWRRPRRRARAGKGGEADESTRLHDLRIRRLCGAPRL